MPSLPSKQTAREQLLGVIWHKQAEEFRTTWSYEPTGCMECGRGLDDDFCNHCGILSEHGRRYITSASELQTADEIIKATWLRYRASGSPTLSREFFTVDEPKPCTPPQPMRMKRYHNHTSGFIRNRELYAQATEERTDIPISSPRPKKTTDFVYRPDKINEETFPMSDINGRHFTQGRRPLPVYDLASPNTAHNTIGQRPLYKSTPPDQNRPRVA